MNTCLVLSAVRGFLILMFRLTQSKRQSSTSVASGSPTSAAPPVAADSTLLQQQRQPLTASPFSSSSSASPSSPLSSTAVWHAFVFGGAAVDECPGTLSLVAFAHFMGLHFLGAFVLLRLGFPSRSRGVIIDAVGTVPFAPCHAVHDWSFIVAVVATGVALRVMRNDADEEDDDEHDV